MEGRKGGRNSTVMKETYHKLKSAWARTSRPVNPPRLAFIALILLYIQWEGGCPTEGFKSMAGISHPKALLVSPLLHNI